MTTRIPAVFQWLLTAAFLVWSCILMVVIMGEDNPESPLSLFDFFLIKVMGIASAYATYKAAKWCYEHNLFPKLICEYIEKCEEEEEL